MLIILMYNH